MSLNQPPRTILTRSYTARPPEPRSEVYSPPLTLTYRYPHAEFAELQMSTPTPRLHSLRDGAIVQHLGSNATITPAKHDATVSFSISSDKRTAAMRDEYLTTHPLNVSLAVDFEKHLREIPFASVVEPLDDRTVSHPDKFRFIPIISSRALRSTLCAAKYQNNTPPDILTTYRDSPTGRPYLDTRQAIGLTYDNHLIALAAAGIAKSGVLSVRQIQDVSGISREDRRAHFKTGLYNGFAWRDTLVREWEHIGIALGATAISVQSHINNYWAPVREHGKAGYDDVAKRLGYEQVKGDWVKVLTRK